jgi:hypothetical protein
MRCSVQAGKHGVYLFIIIIIIIIMFYISRDLGTCYHRDRRVKVLWLYPA